jgi:hypothetical protein
VRFAVLGAAMFAVGAQAQVTNIIDNNSSITVNTSGANGMTAWTVNGNNILSQQSFYYSIGGGPSSAISSISAPTITSSAGVLTATYANSSFSLSVRYSLAGSSLGSGASDLGEQITIQSLNNTALPVFHFYQYASFIGANNVNLYHSSRSPSLFGEAYVDNGLSMSVAENVDDGFVPGANEGETDANTLANVLAGDTLNDTTSGRLGLWAFEWDENIAANGSVIFSKDLNAIVPVPEPSTWALFLVGLAIGGVHLYRRRPVKALARVKA